MSDPSSIAVATGRPPVAILRTLPFDDGLAETQPIDLVGVIPTREEKLP